MIRKFYHPGSEFEGATIENVKIVTPEASTPEPAAETVSPAPEETPIVDKVEVETPAEVAPVAAQVEQPTQTAPPPAAPKEVTQPVVKKNWKELAKEEGIDEKVVGLVDYYKQNGTLKPYLEALSVDYAAMSPEEIMRREIQEQYPNEDSETVELIYDNQVKRKYNLDSEIATEQEMKVGRAMLKSDAEKVRQKFIQKQNEFFIPAKDLSAEQQRMQEEQARIAQEQQDQFKQSLINSPVAQSLSTNKALTLDLGDGSKFNYAVEPSEVMDMLLVPEKFQQATTKRDAAGNIVPDMEALTLQAAFAQNPKGFIKAILTHGKSLGKKEYHDTLENAEKGTPVTTNTGAESLADAFRNRGVRSWVK